MGADIQAMATKNPHQPHDKFFKTAFSRLDVAASFLEQWIPTELSHALDWKTLQLLSGNFIDQHFKSFQSDLLYKVRFRNDLECILILLEHQRKEDPKIWHRMERYMVGARDAIQPLSKSMTRVIPMIISQSPRPWKTSPYLKDSFYYPKNLKSYMERTFSNEKLEIIELCTMSYEDIQSVPFGVLAVKILKAKITNELLGDQIWLDPHMLKITPLDLQFLLTYILASRHIDREQFSHRLHQLQSQPIHHKVMTVLEQYIEEGREEGQTQILQIQLRQKFKAIPRWAEKRLKSATTKDLIRWSERILYKNTLKEILE